MSNKIQLKRGSANKWNEINLTLSKGEPGYETDTGKLKIGDGLNQWTSLPYFASSSSTIDNENMQDNIGNGFLVAGNNILLDYNDNANTLTISNAGTSSVNAALQWTANHTLADGTRYLANDVVYDAGTLYKANFDNESLPVTDTTYWTNVGSGYRLNLDGRDIPNIPYPVNSISAGSNVTVNNNSGNHTISININNIDFTTVPSIDPLVAGRLWRDAANGNVLKVSWGAEPTECPSGKLTFEGWYCCPDNINEAPTAGDCP